MTSVGSAVDSGPVDSGPVDSGAVGQGALDEPVDDGPAEVTPAGAGPADPAGPRDRWRPFPLRGALSWLGCALLGGLVGVLVYRPALRRPFVIDDWGFLQIADGHTVGKYLTDPSQVVYRPGLVAWMAGLWHLVGHRYTLFHLAGLAALVVAASLLYALCRRLELGRVPAALAGVFLLLHPAMITPVVWAAAANAILAPGFLVLVLLLLATPRPRAGRSAAVAVGTLLALASREDAVVLPLLAVGVRLVLPELRRLTADGDARERLRRVVLPTWPVWVVTLVYFGIRLSQGASTKGTQYELTVGGHIGTNLVTLSEYVLGLPLSARRGEVGVAGWQVAGIALLVVVVLLAARSLVRGRPVAAFGVAWTLLGAVPSLGLAKHSIDPYYVDIMLPGFALTVAALLPAGRSVVGRWVGGTFDRFVAAGLVAVFAVVWAGVGGHAVRVQQGRTAFAVAAVRQQQLLTLVGRKPPARSILCFVNPKSSDAAVTVGGALFRVTYHDLTLGVVLISNGKARSSPGKPSGHAPRQVLTLVDTSPGATPPAPGAAALCPRP